MKFKQVCIVITLSAWQLFGENLGISRELNRVIKIEQNWIDLNNDGVPQHDEKITSDRFFPGWDDFDTISFIVYNHNNVHETLRDKIIETLENWNGRFNELAVLAHEQLNGLYLRKKPDQTSADDTETYVKDSHVKNDAAGKEEGKQESSGKTKETDHIEGNSLIQNISKKLDFIMENVLNYQKRILEIKKKNNELQGEKTQYQNSLTESKKKYAELEKEFSGIEEKFKEEQKAKNTAIMQNAMMEAEVTKAKQTAKDIESDMAAKINQIKITARRTLIENAQNEAASLKNEALIKGQELIEAAGTNKKKVQAAEEQAANLLKVAETRGEQILKKAEQDAAKI